MAKKPTNLSEVSFDSRDADIFRISDIKTRVSTTQNYFFPRLEFMVRESLTLVQDVYDQNPYDVMTLVTRPGNRLDAAKISEFSEVYIGISGKKPKGKTIILRNQEGQIRAFPVTGFLVYRIGLSGSIQVVLKNYGTGPMNPHNEKYWLQIEKLIGQHLSELTKIIVLGQISFWGASRFLNLAESFNFRAMMSYLPDDNLLYSPISNFPTDHNRGLRTLVLAFVALYPIAYALTRLAEGEKTDMGKMIEQFKKWWATDAFPITALDLGPQKSIENQPKGRSAKISLPPMDSYSHIRAGVWWQVLARDKWTCLACGRTAKDGVSLEVDHIIPRSKGGKDAMENYQTLCKKCNIGKSNKDNTNLRKIK